MGESTAQTNGSAPHGTTANGPASAGHRGRLLVLAATEVGLFNFASDGARGEWSQRGPFLAPCDISHAAYDPRDGAIWAAANGEQSWVYRSQDLGETWRPMGGPFAVDKIWHVEPGRADEPGTVYAGVMPADLYRSRDGGETWSRVEGLANHATREEWFPGGGGLCLHTVILPPAQPGRLYAGISCAGLFRSDDDGESWTPLNEGVAGFHEMMEAEGVTIRHQAVHRCVHKAVLHPENPDIIFQQNHLGVYRSDDAGESWRSINAGLPSDFGFPIAVGAGAEPAIFVVPEDGETLRTAERLAVWRSRDGGTTWTESTAGLPSGQLNVLREAMAADPLTPTGVYLGTTNGLLYASTDGGDTWTTLADNLPRIRSVKVGMLG